MIRYLNKLNLTRKEKKIFFFDMIHVFFYTCELILSSESMVDDVEWVVNGWLILMILCRSSVASLRLLVISRQTVSNVDQVNRYPFNE